MSDQKAVSANPKKNNGGVIVQAGNTSGSLVVDLAVKSLNASVNTAYGSQVVVDTNGGATNADPHGVTKAVSGGTFAYTPAKGTNFIMRAAGDNASKINNIASSLLNVPGGATNVSINALTKTTRVGAYASHAFNVLAVPSSENFPGLTRGASAGTPVSYVQADDGSTTTGVDNAAYPSRSVPGELTYMFGGKLPKNDAYKAKNSYEA